MQILKLWSKISRKTYRTGRSRLYLPIGKELEFKGLVNVLTGKSYMYKGDGSKEVTEGDTPADMADAVAAARETLVERAVEADDELMMRYLEEKRSLWRSFRKSFARPSVQDRSFP